MEEFLFAEKVDAGIGRLSFSRFETVLKCSDVFLPVFLRLVRGAADEEEAVEDENVIISAEMMVECEKFSYIGDGFGSHVLQFAIPLVVAVEFFRKGIVKAVVKDQHFLDLQVGTEIQKVIDKRLDGERKRQRTSETEEIMEP